MAEPTDAVNQAMTRMADVMETVLTDTMIKLGNSMGVNTDEFKKLKRATEDARHATEGLTEAEKAQAEAVKVLKEKQELQNAAIAKSLTSLKSFGTGLLEQTPKLTNYGDAIDAAGDAAFAFGKSLGPLGTVIGGLVKASTLLLNASLQQSQSLMDAKTALVKIGGAGTVTTDKIYDMAHAADLNSQTLSRMIKPMESLGSSIVTLGRGAGDSQQKFAKLIQATDQERERFARLGITQEEMMQGTADYVKLQALSGVNLKLQGMDAEKLRKASQDYQINLLDLSAMTGKSVQELKDKEKAAAMDAQFQFKNAMDLRKAKQLEIQAQQESDPVRKKELLARSQALKDEVSNRRLTNDQLAKMGPEILQKAVKEIIATGNVSGENAVALAQMGMTEEVLKFGRDLKKGALTAEEGAKMSAKLVDKYNEKAGATYERMSTSLLNGSDAFRNSMGVTSEGMKTFTEQQGESQEKIINDQITNRKKEEDKSKDKAAGAFAWFQNMGIKASKAFDSFIHYINPLQGELTAGKVAVMGLSAAAGAAALALGAIGAKRMASSAMGAVTGGGGLLGGGGGGGLGGLGGMGGGMLQGLASGLRAFGNPQVVLGAAGLAASIAIIGAGIAGAAWLMGKALPTLADGIGSFAKIDGDKLAKTGKGIFFLGTGLAVFGVGGAAAGIGSIIGNLAGGITKFFGGETPFDKVVKFSQLPIDGDKLEKNAKGFAEFAKAMAMVGAGSAIGAIGEIGGAIAGGVTKFFGGETPFDKVVRFSHLDIDENKTKINADAFVAFSNAMSQYKGGASEGITGAVANKVASFFGGGTDAVFKNFEKFSKLDVDPTKVGKLSEAFLKYSQAMAGVGGAAPGKEAISALGSKMMEGAKMALIPGYGMYKAASAAAGGAAPPPAPAAKPAMPAPAAPAAAMAGGVSVASTATKDATVDAAGKQPTGPATATPAVLTKKAAGGSMSDKQVKDMIIGHEGKRLAPYKDSLGLWTVGVGHLIGDGKSLPAAWNRQFSEQEVMSLFDTDFEHHKKLAQSNVPGFGKYDTLGQGAFIDLTFNMGGGWPKKFKNTAKSIAAGDTQGAAAGLENSLWYKQVGRRGPDITSMIRSSKVSARDGGLSMGPSSGYPATLHGNELIIPLNPNSVLAELGKKTKQQVESEVAKATGGKMAGGGDSMKEILGQNQTMITMIADKLDKVISHLADSNSTQDKILRYSQV